METFWCKFEDGWLPPGENRQRILELLKHDESALANIDRALSRHFALKPDAKSKEKPAEVRNDVERLAAAIATIGEILKSRRRAYWLFMDACGEYPEDGTFGCFEQLNGAFSGDGGDLLLDAARSALADLDVTSGRQPSPELNARIRLVGEVALAAEGTGMRSVRGGDFEELVQHVYDGAGIENAQGETIKADGDIRKWLERQGPAGTG